MKKCSLCENEKPHDQYYKDKRGVFSSRCKDCHGVGRRVCVQCGGGFVGKTNVKLCSPECKAKHRPQTFKSCECCGSTFGPVDHISRKFCSYECKTKAQTTGRKRKFIATTEARRANRQVAYAVSTGRLIRLHQCEQCGVECKTEGAHFDYDRPLDVRWLCRSCHVRWDAADPKGGGASVEI